MAVNRKISSPIAGGLLGLAFIFYIVSNAVPIWYVQNISTELSAEKQNAL